MIGMHVLGDLPERIASKILVDEASGCWEWMRYRNELGYGRTTRVRPDQPRNVGVHRVVYELLVGPIPAGLELDHLCRNPACCNPDHLDPVTHRENLVRGRGVSAIHAAKTHCIHGHEFTPENTKMVGREKKHRRCRECDLLNRRCRWFYDGT